MATNGESDMTGTGVSATPTAPAAAGSESSGPAETTFAEPEVPVEELLEIYKAKRPHFDVFLKNILNAIDAMAPADFHRAVYTIRTRLKDPGHFCEKVDRKRKKKKRTITRENLFDEIEDLAGLRIVTMYRWAFPPIHQFITTKNPWWEVIEDKVEAYYVFPEDKVRMEAVGLKPTLRDDNPYTSIHYIVTPPGQRLPKCEIQVRGLHLEAFGEVDHTLRYPDKKPSKLVSDILDALHQSAAVTDWLAHLADAADRFDADQKKETASLSAELDELRRKVDAAEQDKASLEETISKLKKRIEAPKTYPGIGATAAPLSGSASFTIGATGTLGGAVGPDGSITINTLDMRPKCDVCRKPQGSLTVLHRCARCTRGFCDGCGALPRGFVAITPMSMVGPYLIVSALDNRFPKAELCSGCAAYATD
jgi:putative GTP pyrophosphokinase